MEDPWWWGGWGRRRRRRLEEEKEKEKNQPGAMSVQTGGARRLLYMAFNQDNRLAELPFCYRILALIDVCKCGDWSFGDVVCEIH